MLVWEDNFDKDGAPNPDVYSYDQGGSGFGNKELQAYTKNNAYVKGGNLILEARKEEVKGDGFCCKYSSSRIVTKNTQDFLYGAFEVRAKLPKGRGLWPAIWMLPTDERVHGKWPDSGEIDILEHVGYDPNVMHANVHFKGDSSLAAWQGKHEGAKKTVSNPYDWHVFRLDWTPKEIRISMDGDNYMTYKDPGRGPIAWPFNTHFHLMLNIAVGGTWGGRKGVDDSVFPAKMYVDYIRVYCNRCRIKSFHGKFLSADRDEGVVAANKDSADEWEEWEVLKKDGKIVHLRSWHGKFLTAHADGYVHAKTADVAKEWESWHLHDGKNGQKCLKSHHGKFLCAETSGNVKADRPSTSEWEHWQLDFIHNKLKK